MNLNSALRIMSPPTAKLHRQLATLPGDSYAHFLWKVARNLVCTGVLCLLFFTAAVASEQVNSASGPPNLILFLTDDQRRDALGLYNPIIETPHLDELAQRGVLFDHAFVTTSICMTSRASILTGQYARRHQIWDFQTQLSPRQLSETYPALLKTAGYRIGFIGKWGVGKPPENLFHFDRSFAGQGQYRLERNGAERHLTSVMGDDAIEFLERASVETPFCLSISFKAPHVQDSYDLSDDPFPSDPDLDALYEESVIPPAVASDGAFFERLPLFLQNSENRMRWAVRFWGPERYQESIKGYYRLISGVDRVVGRVMEFLHQHSDIAENTVILFTSDNGFFLGEFQLAGKWLPHEPSIQVPLILFDPRQEASKGVRRSEMVLNIDVAPTLLDLAGVPIPHQMQGRSIVPLLRGEQTTWREDFFYEHLFTHPRIPATEALRTREWKYIRYVDQPLRADELYYLANDPNEQNNLVGQSDYEEKLTQLRARLETLRRRAGGADDASTP